MKKIKWITLAAVLILTLGCTTLLASAHGRRHDARSTRSSTASVCTYCGDYSHCFTDSDGDGICDYREDTDAAAGCQYGYHSCRTGTGYCQTEHHQERHH